jgi:hypothetical protein
MLWLQLNSDANGTAGVRQLRHGTPPSFGTAIGCANPMLPGVSNSCRPL